MTRFCQARYKKLGSLQYNYGSWMINCFIFAYFMMKTLSSNCHCNSNTPYQLPLARGPEPRILFVLNITTLRLAVSLSGLQLDLTWIIGRRTWTWLGLVDWGLRLNLDLPCAGFVTSLTSTLKNSDHNVSIINNVHYVLFTCMCAMRSRFCNPSTIFPRFLFVFLSTRY